MFEHFAREYSIDPGTRDGAEAWIPRTSQLVPGFLELQRRFAGVSFNGGLYRVHDASSGALAADAIRAGFPEFASRATPFAFDWLGRHFALDAMRPADTDGPQVLILEPGTGEVLEVPCSLAAFHEDELIQHADAALARTFFDDWAATNPDTVPLSVDACVGYRVPLFLGGTDTLDNLELSDTSVYWSLMGQLRADIAATPDSSD